MVWYFAIKRYDHFLLIFWAITHVQNLFDVVVSNYQLRRHLKWSTTFLSPYSYMKHVDRQPHSFHYWLLIVGNCQRWWFLIFLSFSMTSHGCNEMTHICRILICRLWHYDTLYSLTSSNAYLGEAWFLWNFMPTRDTPLQSINGVVVATIAVKQ